MEGLRSARRIEHGDEIVLPQPVQAARHQIVHLVVAFGDLGEDLVDQALLFVFAHPAETEGDVLFWCLSVMAMTLAAIA